MALHFNHEVANEAAKDYGMVCDTPSMPISAAQVNNKTPDTRLQSRKQRPIEPQAVNVRISRNRLTLRPHERSMTPM